MRNINGIKPYSEMVHRVALSGGPQKYANALLKRGIEIGRLKERELNRCAFGKGFASAGICFGVAQITYLIYDQVQKKKMRKLIEEAESDKQKFVDSVNELAEEPESVS